MRDHANQWPELPLEAWQPTLDTLHMYTQIIGKVRLAKSPVTNHWWHVALYLTARGLTTSPIPDGEAAFQVDFDLIDHRLYLSHSDGKVKVIPLRGQTVADFYVEVISALADLGIKVTITTMPSEVMEPIPFERDTVHATYDPEYANRFWRILLQTNLVLQRFRSDFIGKSSPIHFFWGSFDLAYSRFSGRKAPDHPGGGLLPLRATREAYSHEVASWGFWPGGGPVPYPVFYSYVYPSPEGFRDAPVQPHDAFFSDDLGEFILPYDAVRLADSPEGALLAFCQSTYEAAATLGGWDRAALEKQRTLE